MTSADAARSAPAGAGLDLGLLAPVRAGAAGAGLDDAAVAQALLDVERAWLDVCVDAGLAPADARAASRLGSGADHRSSAWSVDRYDLAGVADRTALGGNALIPLLGDLRAALREDGHPAAAAAVHLGATSQDIVDTALAMLAARTIDEAIPRLVSACDGLAALAARHADDVCVARSLGQHALPTTFGARAAAWLESLSAASADLAQVRGELPVQWAGAAGTSAALLTRRSLAGSEATDGPGDPLDADDLRAALADRLGLSTAPGWHTSRRPIWRLGAAIGGVLAAAGTFGGDVVTGSRREIGELAEPTAPGRGGSSAMPHKRNPVLSVLLRSAAIAAPGHVATLFAAGGDADDERPTGAWHAEWAAVRELLRLLAGAARVAEELGAGLSVDPAAGRANLDLSVPAVLSERIVLVLKPLVDDVAALRACVDDALAQGVGTDAAEATAVLRRALRGLLDEAVLPDADLDDLLDPAGYVGDAPRQVRVAVAAHRARFPADATHTTDLPEDR
ncbi:lyase family protein [Agilicoccus flavus]|uniref:lyase family protein n=1 Tax=Agilicoccus flavus TaxID=2775968 RepID=UPI001CF6BF53|nr:lyase family protein [Agilicoccus flavus]